MEDRGRQHGGGVAVAIALDEMVERADRAADQAANACGTLRSEFRCLCIRIERK
jgi:hypothetical protein